MLWTNHATAAGDIIEYAEGLARACHTVNGVAQDIEHLRQRRFRQEVHTSESLPSSGGMGKTVSLWIGAESWRRCHADRPAAVERGGKPHFSSADDMSIMHQQGQHLDTTIPVDSSLSFTFLPLLYLFSICILITATLASLFSSSTMATAPCLFLVV